MNSSQEDFTGSVFKTRKHQILAHTLIISGIVFSVCGILLLTNYISSDGKEFFEDYTDCEDFDRPGTKCKDSLRASGKVCSCYILINITVVMRAPVTIYYELESYDHITNNYANSRDNNQLAGHLSLKLSPNCGAYTYTDDKKPIAPCGALADSMFNDTFNLQINNEYVPTIRTGLISEADKKPFRNPPGDLKQAFNNFSKPISWARDVWELDPFNPDNNGFQNEGFIAWMKTDWKRKPTWRVNHTGIYENGVPAAEYTLRVKYAYPSSRYDGRRKLIISSIHDVEDPIKYGIGIALVVCGVIQICLISCYVGAFYWMKRQTDLHPEHTRESSLRILSSRTRVAVHGN